MNPCYNSGSCPTLICMVRCRILHGNHRHLRWRCQEILEQIPRCSGMIGLLARPRASRLADFNGVPQGAVSMFFAEQAGEAPEEMDTEQDEREPLVNTAATGTSTPSQASGAYTLSGQPVGALPTGWGAGGSSGGPSIGRVGQSSSGPANKSKR